PDDPISQSVTFLLQNNMLNSYGPMPQYSWVQAANLLVDSYPVLGSSDALVSSHPTLTLLTLRLIILTQFLDQCVYALKDSQDAATARPLPYLASETLEIL
ncbi:unnamed protein product, partial [Mycena citricolor]